MVGRHVEELDQPRLILASRMAEVCGPVACVERLAYTLSRCNHPTGIRESDSWARRWRPERYVFVLRPGLPLWLFWLWQRRGVPTVGLRTRDWAKQPHWSISMLYDAADMCTQVIEYGTREERDDAARQMGMVVTIDHVLQRLAPDA